MILSRTGYSPRLPAAQCRLHVPRHAPDGQVAFDDLQAAALRAFGSYCIIMPVSR
jgi:hypothetical protein